MEEHKQRLDFSSLLESGKSKKKKAKATVDLPRSGGFIKAKEMLEKELEAYPDFSESRFLTAYLEQRATQELRRHIAKQEKDRAQKVLNKMQKIEKEDKELVLAIRSKDFVYNYWMRNNGKIYKEVICRPGFQIKTKKEK